MRRFGLSGKRDVVAFVSELRIAVDGAGNQKYRKLERTLLLFW